MTRRTIVTAFLVLTLLGASAIGAVGVGADAPTDAGANAGANAPASASGESVSHTVRWGETLTSIAWRYGVTVQEIVDANNLHSPNLIYAGQRLIIPIPSTLYTKHTVQRGETLYSIAAAYGVNVWDIARLNGIWNINLIFVGQKLLIPGKDKLPPTTPTPPPPIGVPSVQEEIIISSPSLNDEVTSPVTVTGWGRGFENTLAVDILNENGQVIAQGNAMIDAEVGEIGPFTGTIEFDAPATTQPGRISVYAISPRDGAIEHLNSVTVTLMGKP
ncbi:MAG TPA: LysM peptidoglycan-binding domain-containing protein [Chloroflexi bacterium]|nr:LysM peptidoglycan-binding domain-containing protein [Chloroflexota bacterium]